MPHDPSAWFVQFPMTHWSLVIRAAAPPNETQRQALSELLKEYIGPLRTYLRLRMGVDSAAADDLVQGFVATRILQQDLLSNADPSRGRFRSFLIKALGRYVMNENRDGRAQKRSPPLQIDLESAEEVADGAPTPDESFELSWALRVLERAIEASHAECEASGRTDVWGVFEGRVLGPTLHGAAPTSYADLVERFHFASPSQACNTLVTAKRLFQRCLRGVIGEYESDEAEVEAEIADLRRILQSGRARSD